MSDDTMTVETDSKQSDIIVVKVSSGDSEEVFELERELVSEYPDFKSLIKETSSGNFPKELVFVDITPRAFRIFQRFITTQRLSVKGVSDLVEFYELCFKYKIESLKDQCRHLCRANLTVSTVCPILHIAEHWNDESLSKECFKLIKSNTLQVINSAGFTSASDQVVTAILKCPRLTLQSEGELFTAVLKWGREQCRQQNLPSTPINLRSVLKPVLHWIRFLDMLLEEFVQLVVCEEILTKDEERAIFINMPFDMENLVPIPVTLSNSRSCRFLCNETKFTLTHNITNPKVSHDSGQRSANLSSSTNSSSSPGVNSTATSASGHKVPGGSVFHLTIQVCKGVIEISKIGLHLQVSQNENTHIPVLVTATVVNSQNGSRASTVFKSHTNTFGYIDCKPVQAKDGEDISVTVECLKDAKCCQISNLIKLPFSHDMDNTSVVVKENCGIANTYIHSITVFHK